MAQPGWMRTGKHSKKYIVTAPGATDVGEAVERVDAALEGYAGKVPGWFAAVQKLGYWWYGICIVVALALMFTVGSGNVSFKVASAVFLGVVGAPVTGWILLTLAKLQSRITGAPSAKQALAEFADRARPISEETRSQVETVLAKDPSLEPKLHRLAWNITPDRHSTENPGARKELEGLWAEADPEGAAEVAALVAEMDAKIAALKAKGTI